MPACEDFSMEIKTAKPEDWPRIIEIYNQAVTDGRFTADTRPVTLEERQEWLQQHTGRYPIRIALNDGTIIGWCGLSPWRPGRAALAGTAEISYYVARGWRGKGVADALMKDVIDLSLANGFQNLLAILIAVNNASLNLLRNHGFSRWGELPGVVNFGPMVCSQYIYGKKLFSPSGSPSRLAPHL
jgi:phosphinothricin acetyltransferase